MRSTNEIIIALKECERCEYCFECKYFLDDYWNCQGDIEPCFEFSPKKDSKYRKVEIEAKPNHETNNK